MGYMTLGQTIRSLSGCEVQRLKLGGRIVFQGTPRDMLAADTATAKWMKRRVAGHAE